MDALLEEIVASPALPQYVDTLQALLVDERARRGRFYEEMTEQQKVEFINGVVFMHSPAKIQHVEVVTLLLRLLSIHVDRHNLGWTGSEKCLVCLTRNDYEPEIVFYGREKASLFQPLQMKMPAPDFVVEVLSPSTEHYDRGVKFEDYAAHGISEYWIIDPVTRTVEQYALPVGGTTYQAVGIWNGDAEIVSVAVPGFRLPAVALFDTQANLAALAALSA